MLSDVVGECAEGLVRSAVLIGGFDDSFLGDKSFLARQIPALLAVKKLSVISQFELFPNPATTSISISSSSGDHVEFRDLLGRSVLSSAINNGTIDVSSLPAGVYNMLIFKHGKAVQTTKLSIVR